MTSRNVGKDSSNGNGTSSGLNRNFMPLNSADTGNAGGITRNNAAASRGVGSSRNGTTRTNTTGLQDNARTANPSGVSTKSDGAAAAETKGSKQNSSGAFLANIFGLKRNTSNSKENPQSQKNSIDINANSPEAAALRNSWNRTLFDFKRNSVPGPEVPPPGQGPGTAVIPGTPPSSLSGNNAAGLPRNNSGPVQQYRGPGPRKASNEVPNPYSGQSSAQNSGLQPQRAGPRRVREEMPNSTNGQSTKRGSKDDGEPTNQAAVTNLDGGQSNENEQRTSVNKVTFIVPYQPQSYGVVQPVNIVPVGDCPYCRVGYVYTRFSVLGILLAFIFFPLGIICCLLMQEQRCSYCGAEVGFVY